MNIIYDRPADNTPSNDISFFADRQQGSGIPEAGLGIIENFTNPSARENNQYNAGNGQNNEDFSHGGADMQGGSQSYGENQSEDYQSFADKLRDNIGLFVVCEFLTGSLNARQGILNEVGSDYIVLFDDVQGYYTICDLDSLKFATFYNSRVTPRSFRLRR